MAGLYVAELNMNAPQKITRSEQKRQDIIRAAKRAFLTHGVQGTSMDVLAAEAGVSKRTVYNHFDSKEALFSYIITSLWTQAVQAGRCVYDPARPLRDQLCEALEAEIETINSQEYIELNRVALGHFFYQPEAIKEEVARLAVTEKAIVRWINAAVKDGRLQVPDVTLAVQQLHNLIKGSCFWPQLMHIEPMLDAPARRRLAEQTADLFLARYGV